MCRCESWTVKKAEHQRIDTFEMWCWGRLLRVPWTARRSNQSILKESTLNIHWKDWCWAEAPTLWPPDVKSQLTGKEPDAGKDWRREEKGMTRDGWMATLTRWTWVWASSGSWWGTGKPGVLHCSPWGCKESDTTEQLNNNNDQEILSWTVMWNIDSPKLIYNWDCFIFNHLV